MILSSVHLILLIYSREPLNWKSKRGDKLSLVYWNCILMEMYFTFTFRKHIIVLTTYFRVTRGELGLPEAGTMAHLFEVPLPQFYSFDHPTDLQCDRDTHYRLHFCSFIHHMVNYRKICNRFFAGLTPDIYLDHRVLTVI